MFYADDKIIKGFMNEYRWLSNFWILDNPISFKGIEFTTTEQLYQACKCHNHNEFLLFDKLSASQSKKLGSKIQLRDDWNDIKLNVMLHITRLKYSKKQPNLRKLLLNTNDKEIVEYNNWNDTFYGVTDKGGLNHLGNIIMKVRDEIRG